MSFQPNFPPSLLSKVEEDTADGAKKRSKEEYRKMKELEEARKSATVPAMKDEEGHEINPHIPQYIMQAPWYYGSLKPTLTHQRIQNHSDENDNSSLNNWYRRGVKEESKTNIYRKGACENCGSMTHAKKDCLERPRKLGAKLTGDDIAPDEYVQPDLKLGFEAKRDRWNGYDPKEQKRLIEEFQRLEEARKTVKAKQLEESFQDKSLVEEDNLKDEDKYGDELDMPGQKFDSKQRQSIRNLRIREDTAKYLFNLDPNSAYYDPKTRSMRENPFGDKPPSEVPYAGDNWDRYGGDTIGMMKSQVFAWEMHDQRGLNVHLQADPTRLELLSKKVDEAKSEVQTLINEEILDKYGGREHFDAPPKELLLAQSEKFTVYSKTGKIIQGEEKVKVLSKYEEDVYPNNHTSVWGSYWRMGQWGYKCCRSLIRESYCTGLKTVTDTDEVALPEPNDVPAIEDAEHGTNSQTDVAEYVEETTENENIHEETKDSGEHIMLKRKCNELISNKKSKKKRKNKEHSLSDGDSSNSDSESSDDSTSSTSSEERKRREKKRKRNKKKKQHKQSSRKSKKRLDKCDSDDEIADAVRKEKARQADVDELMKLDERKRPYHSRYEVREPTKAEMEAFHLTKRYSEDPMNNFK